MMAAVDSEIAMLTMRWIIGILGTRLLGFRV